MAALMAGCGPDEVTAADFEGMQVEKVESKPAPAPTSASATESTPAATPEATPPDPEVVTVPVGEPLDVGGGKVVIEGHEVYENGVPGYPDYQGAWVAVRFTYTYQGTEPVETGSFQDVMLVFDAQDRTFYPDDYATIDLSIDAGRDTLYVPLNPSVPQPMLLAFPIAPDSSDLEVRFKDVIDPYAKPLVGRVVL